MAEFALVFVMLVLVPGSVISTSSYALPLISAKQFGCLAQALVKLKLKTSGTLARQVLSLKARGIDHAIKVSVGQEFGA